MVWFSIEVNVLAFIHYEELTKNKSQTNQHQCILPMTSGRPEFIGSLPFSCTTVEWRERWAFLSEVIIAFARVHYLCCSWRQWQFCCWTHWEQAWGSSALKWQRRWASSLELLCLRYKSPWINIPPIYFLTHTAGYIRT